MAPKRNASSGGKPNSGMAASAVSPAVTTTPTVASSVAAERYGLEIRARNIEDIPANFTRFVVVSRAG